MLVEPQTKAYEKLLFRDRISYKVTASV